MTLNKIISQRGHDPRTRGGFRVSAVTEAHDRLGRLDALDPDQMAAGLAWLAGYSPAIFDATLDAVEPWAGDGAADRADDAEPYCTVCGARIGIFLGRGDNWRHYRGGGTAASKTEPYDAAHVPVIGWRPA